MFAIKDYYTILQLEPSAGMAEIKKAYRRLALQYHPDKNNNDSYASAQFADIKEAYEILTDPAKKEYYLQQRWYNKSMGYRKTHEVVTPVSLLKQSLELEKYVSKLDVFRMDKAQLQKYLLELLSEDTIEKINQFQEAATNKSIISVLLKTLQPLPAGMAEPVIHQLQKFSGVSEQTKKQMQDYLSGHKQRDTIEKYKPWTIALLTLLLCTLIWLMSR
jgi:curved DNA-binding protein CbpA